MDTTITNAKPLMAQLNSNEQLNGSIFPRGQKGEKGEKGDKGEIGPQGKQGLSGSDGIDGFSPIVEVTKNNNTSTISIIDKNGVHVTEIVDGKDGEDGKNGIDGTNGTNGRDGYIQYTAGENIKIENNVISAKGGSQIGLIELNIPEVDIRYGNYNTLRLPIQNAINNFIKTNNLTVNNINDLDTKFNFRILSKFSIDIFKYTKTISYNKMCFCTEFKPEMSDENGNMSNMYWYFLYIQLTVSNNQVTIDNILTHQLRYQQVLMTKNNTYAYTPTANYHPATKKYVDDRMPAQPTSDGEYKLVVSNGVATWVQI